MQKIATFFVNVLMKSPKFNSKTPVSDVNLLFPDFVILLNKCINIYKETYPNQGITFTETYRSNTLQLQYYQNGASKLKANGMHHYGIAADCIFIVDGKRTYKGDITLLRKIFKENGLIILGLWDALHVQYIPVSQQQELRNVVSKAIS